MDAERVGARLRKLRKLRGVTQQQLADHSRFSASLIKKVEQGTVPPSTAFVTAVARALNVPVAQLYGTDDRQMTQSHPAHSSTSYAPLWTPGTTRDRKGRHLPSLSSIDAWTT